MKRFGRINLLNKVLMASLIFSTALVGSYLVSKRLLCGTTAFTTKARHGATFHKDSVPDETEVEVLDYVITDSERDEYKQLTNHKYGYSVEFPANYEVGPKSLERPKGADSSSSITFYDPKAKSFYPGSYVETYVRRLSKPLNNATADEATEDLSSLCGGVYEGYTTFCVPQKDKIKVIKSSPVLVYAVYFKEFISGTKEFVKDVGPMYLGLSGTKDSDETLLFIIRNGNSEIAKEMALSVAFN